MTESDFKQLGMERDGNVGLRRLNSVMIDAKVVPLLKDMDQYGYCHDTLRVTPASGLESRIVCTRDTKNALRMFLKTVRSCISQARGMDFWNEGTVASHEYDICDGQL